jgi:hypothetical protein
MPLRFQKLTVIFILILLWSGAGATNELPRGIGNGLGEPNRAKIDFECELSLAESAKSQRTIAGKSPIFP